jgi:hypothetical protein
MGRTSLGRFKVEKVLTKAERYWRLTAGPALKEIRDNALFKAAGFASFERYVDERWDMSRARAYQLIDSVRAMKALEDVTPEVPNERQLRAILPVVDDHGKDAAEQVWREGPCDFLGGREAGQPTPVDGFRGVRAYRVTGGRRAWIFCSRADSMISKAALPSLGWMCPVA